MLLAFETSCDETSAAVVHKGSVLSNVVSSQIKLHDEYGGVVPELAAREHLKNLLPVTRTALREAQISSDRLDAMAATQGPGLPGALMVGLKVAQALAFVLRRPLLGVHHHEAHLYSPWITGVSRVEGRGSDERNAPSSLDNRHSSVRADFQNFQPNVSLIVSGGRS